MLTSIPSLLRLRVLSVRPRLLLTEIHLVDDVLRYRRIDSRDHVPTEARAERPSAAGWARFRVVLDEVSFCSWPRRWPRVHEAYEGEFAIAVSWGGRAVMSAGPIGSAAEVDGALDAVARLAGATHDHVRA